MKQSSNKCFNCGEKDSYIRGTKLLCNKCDSFLCNSFECLVVRDGFSSKKFKILK